MPLTYIGGMPGIGPDRTATPRIIFDGNAQAAQYLERGRVVDGSNSRDPLNVGDPDVLEAGLLMGRITASGKYAPSVLGVSTAAYTSTGTSLTVSVATAAEIVRRMGSSGTFTLTGPPTSGGTVASVTVTFSAVDTTTGILTVADLGADFIAGSLAQPADGSENILALLDEIFGLKVTDQDGNDQDTPTSRLLVAGGVIRTASVLNYPADSSLQAWIKSSLNTCGRFMFDDNF